MLHCPDLTCTCCGAELAMRHSAFLFGLAFSDRRMQAGPIMLLPSQGDMTWWGGTVLPSSEMRSGLCCTRLRSLYCCRRTALQDY